MSAGRGIPALAATLLLWPTLGNGQERERRAPPPNPVQVWGVVVDRQTLVPVEGADVHLTLVGLPVEDAKVTDERGRFAFGLVSAGVYRVEVSRIGYQYLADDVHLSAGMEAQLQIEMVAEAVELEPVVVTATRRLPILMGGFWERRQLGIGTFITRADVEARSPMLVSDLFRTIPGIRVVQLRAAGGADIRSSRSPCRPMVFVDGVVTVPSVGIDMSLTPQDVEAIEVYRGAEAPAQYGRDPCGAVLIWTRVPEPGNRSGSLWKRLLVVAGFVTGAYLLTN